MVRARIASRAGSALASAVCATSFLAPMRQGKPSQVKQLMHLGSRGPAWLIATGNLKRVPAQLLGGVEDSAGGRRQGRRRERVRRRARGLDGIDAGGAVDLQQLLGGGVVALEIAVADRPPAKSLSRSRKAAPPKKIELPPTASLGKARAPAPSARWSTSIGLSPR